LDATLEEEVMAVQTQDLIDIIYLAGLFDGEGCVNISKKYDGHQATKRQGNLSITIKLNDCGTTSWLKENFDGSVSKPKPYGNRKQAYAWTLGADSAADLLYDMLPYLKIKIKQAMLGMDWQATVKHNGGKPSTSNPKYSPDEQEWRETLRELLHEANHRGVV